VEEAELRVEVVVVVAAAASQPALINLADSHCNRSNRGSGPRIAAGIGVEGVVGLLEQAEVGEVQALGLEPQDA
jgi:hypothetical protein